MIRPNASVGGWLCALHYRIFCFSSLAADYPVVSRSSHIEIIHSNAE